MGVNLVNTADGEELINLTADTVSALNLLEGETAHDASGEQITGKVTVIGDNLFDNGDFSVNQRGFQTGVVGRYGYTVDRWYTANVAAQFITVDGDTVRIQRSGTTEFAAFGQPIEKLKAGTYTVAIDILSADTSIEQIICRVATDTTAFAAKTLVQPSVEFNAGRYAFTFDIPEDAENVMVYFYSTGFTAGNPSFVITKPKLEVGSVATPFGLPNRALELVKCQRQYMPAPMESIPCLATTANSFYFLIPLPVTMRIKPSFTAETVLRLARCTGNITLAANLLNNSEYSVSTALFTNGLLVNVAKASHDISAGDVVLDISSGGLSAEL